MCQTHNEEDGTSGQSRKTTTSFDGSETMAQNTSKRPKDHWLADGGNGFHTIHHTACKQRQVGSCILNFLLSFIIELFQFQLQKTLYPISQSVFMERRHKVCVRKREREKDRGEGHTIKWVCLMFICLFVFMWNQITGQEEAMYEATVTVTTKGRKNDLPVKNGDLISIIRTTNCPKGKWLARDSSNNCECRFSRSFSQFKHRLTRRKETLMLASLNFSGPCFVLFF